VRFSRTIAFLAFTLISSRASASIQAISDLSLFNQSVSDVKSVSFDIFPAGFYPATSLQLGDVSVVLTNAGSSPIFAPGAFGGFTTNFLSTAVEDNQSNVVITFPPGSLAGGMLLTSVYPITLTAKSFSGELKTVIFSSGNINNVSFLGFESSSGIQTITLSSPSQPSLTPIVNIGNISYGSILAPVAPIPSAPISAPAMNIEGELYLIFGFLVFARFIFRKRSTLE